jgi:hypothetical protein
MLLVLLPAIAGTAMPLAIALRSVPIVTTAPLVVLLIGRGAVGTIVLVAVMVFFPTFVACLHGLRQAPGQVMDVLDSYAAGPLTRLMRVRIPAMLPAFFAAARMAVPASVLARHRGGMAGHRIGHRQPDGAVGLPVGLRHAVVFGRPCLGPVGARLCPRGRASSGGSSPSTRRNSWHDLRRAAFAIPGDITTPTGGYIYERRLLEGLRAQGRDVRHLRLGPSFPDPTPADMADAVAQLRRSSPTAS